jgi:hypothetical protein
MVNNRYSIAAIVGANGTQACPRGNIKKKKEKEITKRSDRRKT